MPVPADRYTNQAYLSVAESAPNTLTFSKLETGISIYEKVGWLISRLDYDVYPNPANFGAVGDTVAFGISVADTLATVSMGLSAIVDINHVTRVDIGTAATGLFWRRPFTKDFSSLPGGGLLIPPNPIYIYARGQALTSAMTISARMFYTVKSLKADEFWELVEQRRMIGA